MSIMYIVSKDERSIVNAEQITSIYIGADGCTIKADFENGKGCQIGRYMSEKACRIAIKILAEDSVRNSVCRMPTDAAINARISLEEVKAHHISGKKTKGYGGS